MKTASVEIRRIADELEKAGPSQDLLPRAAVVICLRARAKALESEPMLHPSSTQESRSDW